jgi:hypothetical protein
MIAKPPTADTDATRISAAPVLPPAPKAEIDATQIGASPRAARRDEDATQIGSAPPRPPSGDQDATQMGASPAGELDVEAEILAEPETAAPGDAEEARFRGVYDQFITTRTSCGEGGDLAYEKFKSRLLESRAAVIAKHACRDVEFQVYVKNGRAALKAVPAK